MTAPLRLRADRALDVARAHPRHLVLAALVIGLLGSAASPWLLSATAAATAVLGSSRRIAALAVVALVGGAGWAAERTRALEDSVLARSIGQDLSGRVVALESPRRRRAGEASFRVRWLEGRAAGEVGLLRLRRGSTAHGPPTSAAPAPAVIVPGSVLEISARIEALSAWEAHQRRRGARAAMAARAWERVGGRRPGLAGQLDAARDRSRAGLAAGTGPGQAALLRGMVLGEDDAISDGVRDDFRRSGLAHLLAVSGQNVMLLVILAMALATVVGASLRLRLAFALALVLAYVPLAGGGPSIQRAGVMGAAGLVAALAGRATDRWYAVLLAAAITLAVNPLNAGDPGWQLSFAAVIGLLAGATAATRVLISSGLPRALAEVVAISAVATVATAPLLILHFGELSLVSLPANVLAAPAVAPVMWLGMLAAGIAQLEPAFALPLTWCNGHLVAYIEWVANTTAAVPHSTVALTAREALVTGGAATGVLVGLTAVAHRCRETLGPSWSRAPVRAKFRSRPWVPGLVAAALVCAWLLSTARSDKPAVAAGELRVSFLDVGQGDATLLQTRRAAVLFDTGPPDGPVLERLGEAGVERLDALILTHAQADHEGAAPAVIARLRPRLVLNGGDGWPTSVQGALEREVASAGGRVVAAHDGQAISLDGIAMTTLWPPRADRPDTTRDPNETALVTHVRHGEFDLLLPADAESGVLRRLDLPRVEALKVSHHGSEDAGLPDILSRLRPAVAAIEVGRGNPYGHPAPSTLAALRVVPQVARTDVDGTVTLHVRGGVVELER